MRRIVVGFLFLLVAASGPGQLAAHARPTDGGGPDRPGLLGLRVSPRVDAFVGVTEGGGIRPSRAARPSAPQGLDEVVAADPALHENSPSIAQSPTNRNAVAFFQSFTLGQCLVAGSTNNGVSWTVLGGVPLLAGDENCFGPQVEAAPDGRFFYLAYLSSDATTDVSNVAVYRLDGRTLNPADNPGPFVALDGTNTNNYDAPSLGVHRFSPDPAARERVYVAATNFRSDGRCLIVFSASATRGRTWPDRVTPQVLGDPGGGCGGPDPAGGNFPVLQGSQVVGASAQDVLVCWYHSGTDGWGPDALPSGGGRFGLRCRNSPNLGVTFQNETVVTSVMHELPFFLCPEGEDGDGIYHRVWTAMFPFLDIAANGQAHMVFTADPNRDNTGGECGDVLHVASLGPPYTGWSGPVTLGAGAGAFQGYPTIVASEPGCQLDVFYMDHRRSPVDARNLMYDVFGRRTTDCGGGWSNPARITDTSSFSDFLYVGDHLGSYSDAVTEGSRFVIVAWTDRRDRTGPGEEDPANREDDVFSDRFVLP